jgi:hypothetical protein
MREPSAPAYGGGASGSRSTLQERTAHAAADKTAVAPPALLAELTRAIDGGLGALRENVAPLLGEVGQGLAALFPGAEGERLPPKEQAARQDKVSKALDELEDVLEALQLAVAPQQGQAGSAGSRGGS